MQALQARGQNDLLYKFWLDPLLTSEGQYTFPMDD